MTNKLFISTALVMLTTSAFAADLPSHMMAPVYLPPPLPVFSWTGLYVGGQVGYGFGHAGAESEPGFFDVFGTDLSASSSGVLGGGHVGYNYALPALGISGLIVGIEGDVDGGNQHSFRSGSIPFFFNIPVTIAGKSDIQGSVRGRLGIAVDRVLFYATGGAAFAQIQATETETILGTTTTSETHNRAGYTVGGGVEYALTPNWSLRAQYRYSDFGKYDPFSASVGGGNSGTRAHYIENAVTVGFSYLFTSPIVPVVAKY